MTAAVLSAVYLGLLCAVSPCPLATNIAAVSFLCRKSGSRGVLLAGGLYLLGRLAVFCLLGVLMAKTMESAPQVSHALQKYMDMFLGPLLILIAMLLLGLLKLPGTGGINFSGTQQKYLEKMGPLSALLLGILFALSFCPSSAVLFFGTLLPLAVKTSSPLLLSGIFGLSSTLPVVVFAFIIASGSRKLAAAFDMTTTLERRATKITGGIFLAIGIYFTIIQLLQ